MKKNLGIILATLGCIVFFALLVLCYIAEGCSVEFAILAVGLTILVAFMIVGFVYLVLWLLS